MKNGKPPKPAKKRWPWILLVIALFVVGGFLALNALGSKGPQAPLVSGVAVKEEPIAYKIFTRGDVQSKQVVDIVPKVSGRVEVVHVKEGALVKKGDVLLTLDVEDIQNQLEDLKIELSIANATLAQLEQPSTEAEANNRALLTAQFEQAKKDFANAETLFAAGSYSQAQVDQAKMAMKNAEQAVLANKSSNTAQKTANERKIQTMRIESINLKRARLEETLKDASIVAPVDGTVTKVAVKALDMAAQNVAVVSIQNLAQLEIATNINQYDIGKIEVGQHVNVTADGLKDKVYPGTISRISAVAMKSNNGQSLETVVPVIIDLDNKSGDFKPNFNANVEIVIEEADKALVLPYEATKVEKDGARKVFVIAGGKLEERKIATGIESDLMLQITGDTLKVGDVVLLNPDDTHTNGMAVTYMEEAKK